MIFSKFEIKDGKLYLTLKDTTTMTEPHINSIEVAEIAGAAPRPQKFNISNVDITNEVSMQLKVGDFHINGTTGTMYQKQGNTNIPPSGSYIQLPDATWLKVADLMGPVGAAILNEDSVIELNKLIRDEEDGPRLEFLPLETKIFKGLILESRDTGVAEFTTRAVDVDGSETVKDVFRLTTGIINGVMSVFFMACINPSTDKVMFSYDGEEQRVRFGGNGIGIPKFAEEDVPDLGENGYGTLIFNTTEEKLQVYTSTGWQTITSA